MKQITFKDWAKKGWSGQACLAAENPTITIVLPENYSYKGKPNVRITLRTTLVGVPGCGYYKYEAFIPEEDMKYAKKKLKKLLSDEYIREADLRLHMPNTRYRNKHGELSTKPKEELLGHMLVGSWSATGLQ